MVSPHNDCDYKVLVIAEAANPTWTSVPLVGWSLAHAIRSVADVHLVTQIRNRSAILDYGYIEGQDFTAIDSELIMRPLWKLSNALRGGAGKGWTTSSAINAMGYYYFEYLIWKQFKGKIHSGDFDIVHRITPLSPTVPSLLAGKCMAAGIPFVLGPLNGGVPWPKGFGSQRRQEKEWLSYIRNVYKLLPGYRSTLKDSAAIISGSKYTQSQIPDKYQDKCIYIPENAIDPTKFDQRNSSEQKQKLRICFVGRLVPYKGPDMLIEAALPFLRQGTMELDIIGDGPLMPDLLKIIEREKIEEQITMHGWVEHDVVQTVMRSSAVFAFPSIREFGGGVVLEAMALGIVPIVVDYAGPGELVDKTVGFKAPLGSRGEIIASFTSIFEEIINNPTILEVLSDASFKRVHRDFTWQAKAKQVAGIYEWVVGDSELKPNLFDDQAKGSAGKE